MTDTLKSPGEYAAIKDGILNALPREDAEQLPRIVQREIISLCDGANLRRLSRDDIRANLGKRHLTPWGGGKDSGFGTAMLRATQIHLLQEFGDTFIMPAVIGLQPGMTAIIPDIDRAMISLGFTGDPLVEPFFIGGKKIYEYRPDFQMPRDVIDKHRKDVLMNGHIFGGAGRRTFCDDCNFRLADWIATGLVHSKADLYSTGDSPRELAAQINGDVPHILQKLGGVLPERGDLSEVAYAFRLIEELRRKHAELVHEDLRMGDAIKYGDIPDHTRFVPLFPPLEHKSQNRLPFLRDVLKMNLLG